MPDRIVYVVATPSPNRNAEMDRVASGLGTDAVHTVFISSEWQSAEWWTGLPKICRYHMLDGDGYPRGHGPIALRSLLDKLEPSVVIVGGYAQPALRATMSWCRERKVGYCLRSDSSIWTDRHKGWAKYVVRRVRLTPKVAAARSCLITGRLNRAFWLRYGMQPRQEGWWPQWIDYEHFATARRIDPSVYWSLCDAHGITTTLNFLYVGRLVSLKRIDRICNGLLACAPNVGLILVGSGPEETRLRQRYASKLKGRLHFVGGVDPADLPQWYALGDALVLASGPRENWGLILNEAAAAGLPIVCHNRVGAAADLLHDGRNGVALRTNRSGEWAAVLRRLSSNPEELVRMGHESIGVAEAWKAGSNPVECASALLANT